MLKLPTYVLITPARNEAQYIALTIESVIGQTVRPLKWIIVSDGSTDGTDDIVGRYTRENPWIVLVRSVDRPARNFASKVHAFNVGLKELGESPYDAIGNVDGDISFGPEYFSFLLHKLAEDPALGLVGTAFHERGKQAYDYRLVGIEHVTGCCQVFRRECFEDIGGYVPSKGGAIDSIAVIAARTKGWKTRTFLEQHYIHHREMGTAQQGALKARFKSGAKDYMVGNHPVWEFLRAGYQMTKRPYLIGGAALLAGYLWSLCRNISRPVSDEMLVFHRRDQMRRLRNFFTRSPRINAA